MAFEINCFCREAFVEGSVLEKFQSLERIHLSFCCILKTSKQTVLNLQYVLLVVS